MSRYIRTVLILILLPFSLFSQNSIDSVVAQVEKNNTTLLALRKQLDAQKLENKTGIYLKNPEVEFNYLWGTPSAIGNRTDINVKQSFDFPTAYSYKNQISDLRNQQADLEFQRQRKDILLETRLICIDLVYANAKKAIYEKRMFHAQSIANSSKAKFEKGETNILEYNKAQLNLLNTSKEAEANEIERNALLAELVRLNGGLPISLNDSNLLTSILPADFDQWYKQVEQDNPVLAWLKQEIVISQKQEKLNSAMSLPKFYAGYMSEKVVGEQFQGITAGISIPLWENKNTVKQAQAQTLALQSMEVDNMLQFYNQLKIQYAKAISLQKSVADYRSALQAYDNSELLKKALDKGEIDLTDYILELSLYYSSVNSLLQLEREMNQAIAKLYVYLY